MNPFEDDIFDVIETIVSQYYYLTIQPKEKEYQLFKRLQFELELKRFYSLFGNVIFNTKIYTKSIIELIDSIYSNFQYYHFIQNSYNKFGDSLDLGLDTFRAFMKRFYHEWLVEIKTIIDQFTFISQREAEIIKFMMSWII